MAKTFSLIMLMFGIVLTPLIAVGIASYYGTSDWQWIAQQDALFTLVLMVLGLAFFALFSWLKGRR